MPGRRGDSHDRAAAGAAGGGQRGRRAADPAGTAQGRVPDRVGPGGHPAGAGAGTGRAALGSADQRPPDAQLQFRRGPGRAAQARPGPARHHRVGGGARGPGDRGHAPGRPGLHLQGQPGAAGAGGAAGAAGGGPAPGPPADRLPAGGQRNPQRVPGPGGGAGGGGHRHHRPGWPGGLPQRRLRAAHRGGRGPGPAAAPGRAAGPAGPGRRPGPGGPGPQLGRATVPDPGRAGTPGGGRQPVAHADLRDPGAAGGGGAPGRDPGDRAGAAAPSGPEDGCPGHARRRHRPRLQQRAHHHPGLGRAHQVPGARGQSAPAQGGRDPARRHVRLRTDPADPRLQPQGRRAAPAPGSDGHRPRRPAHPPRQHPGQRRTAGGPHERRVGGGGPGHDPAGGAQPGHQRAPGHAARGRDPAGGAHRGAGRAALRDARRRPGRAADSAGHRLRHEPGGAGAVVRTLFHHQGAGQRHRAGPGHGAQHGAQGGRPHPGAQRPRPGQHLPGAPAPGIGPSAPGGRRTHRRRGAGRGCPWFRIGAVRGRRPDDRHPGPARAAKPGLPGGQLHRRGRRPGGLRPPAGRVRSGVPGPDHARTGRHGPGRTDPGAAPRAADHPGDRAELRLDPAGQRPCDLPGHRGQAVHPPGSGQRPAQGAAGPARRSPGRGAGGAPWIRCPASGEGRPAVDPAGRGQPHHPLHDPVRAGAGRLRDPGGPGRPGGLGAVHPGAAPPALRSAAHRRGDAAHGRPGADPAGAQGGSRPAHRGVYLQRGQGDGEVGPAPGSGRLPEQAVRAGRPHRLRGDPAGRAFHPAGRPAFPGDRPGGSAGPAVHGGRPGAGGAAVHPVRTAHRRRRRRVPLLPLRRRLDPVRAGRRGRAFGAQLVRGGLLPGHAVQLCGRVLRAHGPPRTGRAGGRGAGLQPPGLRLVRPPPLRPAAAPGPEAEPRHPERALRRGAGLHPAGAVEPGHRLAAAAQRRDPARAALPAWRRCGRADPAQRHAPGGVPRGGAGRRHPAARARGPDAVRHGRLLRGAGAGSAPLPGGGAGPLGGPGGVAPGLEPERHLPGRPGPRRRRDRRRPAGDGLRAGLHHPGPGRTGAAPAVHPAGHRLGLRPPGRRPQGLRAAGFAGCRRCRLGGGGGGAALRYPHRGAGGAHQRGAARQPEPTGGRGGSALPARPGRPEPGGVGDR